MRKHCDGMVGDDGVWRPLPVDQLDFDDVAGRRQDARRTLGMAHAAFRDRYSVDEIGNLLRALVDYRDIMLQLDRRLATLKERKTQKEKTE